MKTRSIAAAALVAMPLLALPAAALAADQPAYLPGRRPIALPLLAGATHPLWLSIMVTLALVLSVGSSIAT